MWLQHQWHWEHTFREWLISLPDDRVEPVSPSASTGSQRPKFLRAPDAGSSLSLFTSLRVLLQTCFQAIIPISYCSLFEASLSSIMHSSKFNSSLRASRPEAQQVSLLASPLCIYFSLSSFLFLNYYFFLPNRNVFVWLWWYRVSEQQLWSQSSWDQIFAYPHATCLHLGKLISLSWFPHLQDGNICGKE